jgi:flagellar operon protein
LSQDDLARLDSAVQKAKTKGVENTLILSEKGAFIINVSSHVVITAMDQKDMKENIFTQIDGAVVI